ncbi:hypothetical protein BGZ46_009762 [Entomortierella lignicola]|nr:hypothetical protein BGZ46_009762 [Entomortierella lignicola]
MKGQPDGSTSSSFHSSSHSSSSSSSSIHSTPSSRPPSRPPSVIWSQLSKPPLLPNSNNNNNNEKMGHRPLSNNIDNKKERNSLIHIPTALLEDTLFNPKGRKPDIHIQIVKPHQFTRAESRRERASKVTCTPKVTEALPLKPKVLSNGTHDFDPTVIVLSYDGLRADYLDRGLTPNFTRVGEKGVVAEFMQPSFPTLTFPNHWTLATGLYPASHGIVANMFYDPVLGQDFNYKIPEKSWDPKWWGGEPIWETAVQQNQRSGVIMWPGGEALRSVRPTYHERFQSLTTPHEKMAKVLEWLDKPREERPTVISAYIGEVDSAGHDFGPDSRRCAKALVQVDEALGELLQGLSDRNLDNVVNLVLVSDHGMSYVTPEQCIYYDDYIDTSDLIFEESLQPHLAISTKDPKRQHEIYHALKDAQRIHNLPFQVYRREEIPARFNYALNPRIPPVVVLADPGYVMTRRDMGLSVVGIHGWDNQAVDMRAIFMASGPSFPNQGPTKLPPFENVELHEIIARTVGLKVLPGTTDGVLNGYIAQPC